MNKIISFHSSRGGTGKTIIAVNLSALLAHKGLSVALMDLDFRAPSLHHILSGMIKEPIKFWVNDYLNSQCAVDDSLIAIHRILNLRGNLLVGFANPSVRAIEDILGKSRDWEAKALKKLFDLRNFLFKDLGIDLCIYDTSPGIQYSSLNAIIASDLTVFVSTSDPLDVEGVRNILNEFNDIFENKTYILLNKVFPEADVWSYDKQTEFTNQLSKDCKNPVIGMIPCYCDILKAKRSQLLAFEKPSHPFSKKLEEIAERLFHVESALSEPRNAAPTSL